jgi:hypothetical protein
MDDFFLNRMLFEWLRDREIEQAHTERIYSKEFNIMNLHDCYFKDSILFFLYDPLPRVHAI